MIHQVTEDVYVQVRQKDFVLPQQRRQVPALEYVLNRSLQLVTVCMDFTQSLEIRIVISKVTERSANGLVLEVTVEPLQRCQVAHVLQTNHARGYVQVSFNATVDSKPRDIESREESEAVLRSCVMRSARAYAPILTDSSILNPEGSVPPIEVIKWCDDMNRWSRKQGVDFVDPVFPPECASLVGSSDDRMLLKVAVTWRHLREVIDRSWCLVDLAEHTKQGDQLLKRWNAGVLSQDSWVCAQSILDEMALRWCKEWFDEREMGSLMKDPNSSSQRSVVRVRLCREGQEWVSVVVDLFVPVLARHRCGGLASAWPGSGEYYSVLLQKAYAKLRGSYVGVASMSTHHILQELTGVPATVVYGGIASEKKAAEVMGDLINTFRKVKRRDRKLTLVSFGELDHHHCSFKVVNTATGSSTSPSRVTLQDPMYTLRAFLPRLDPTIDIDSQDDTVSLAEADFFRLSPVIVELRTDLSYSWRRRKICTSSSTALALQVAISCSSVQEIIVRGYASPLSGNELLATLSVTVDRVEDTGAWTRIQSVTSEEKDGDPEVPVQEMQLHWTGTPGEYVVSLTLDCDHPEGHAEAISQPTLAKVGIDKNIDLLFRCLDRDMDGAISSHEIEDFLRIHEQHDSPSVDVRCSAFVHECGSPGLANEGYVLTKEDLLQVYESLVLQDGDRHEELMTLIWKDLNSLLGIGHVCSSGQPSEHSCAVYQLCCVVSSDRSDSIIAILK